MQAQIAGQTIELNDEGFLVDKEQWNREVAQALAAEAGIQLTDRHWLVLEYCRKDAANTGDAPGLRRIAKESGVDMRELYKLFPKGPGKLAARIAGLPKPKACI